MGTHGEGAQLQEKKKGNNKRNPTFMNSSEIPNTLSTINPALFNSRTRNSTQSAVSSLSFSLFLGTTMATSKPVTSLCPSIGIQPEIRSEAKSSRRQWRVRGRRQCGLEDRGSARRGDVSNGRSAVGLMRCHLF